MESGNKLNENIKYLDNLLLSLPQPNIDPVTHEMKKPSLSGYRNLISTKVSKSFKSWQSGKPVNESGAKEFLIACINDPALKDSLKNHSGKIMKLYERLAHLSNGANGTWADGIDRELLVTSTEIIEEEEPLIRDLKTRIFDKVLQNSKELQQSSSISEDISIEQDWIEPQEGDNSDVVGIKHTFKKMEGQPPPTNRILFQICADEFGLGSELEGSQSLIMMTYLHSFLVNSHKNNNNESSLYSEIIDEFKSSIELKSPIELVDQRESFSITESIVDTARNQIIHSLDNGKARLILGGWCGKPHGHAIYYEIIPDKNGTVNFRLYNTGAGISNHHSVRDGHKIKYLPYCEWKGITKKKVLSNNFLQSLYELNTYKEDEEGSFTNFNADDIYVGLKSILSPTDEISKGEEYASEEYMSPQRSGVCSSRSLMAFMHSKLKLADYKRFKCDFKLQVLCDFLQTYSTNDKVKVEDWRLIRKTHQSICRSIIKLHEKKIVGDDYITSVQKVLQDSADWIDANEKCRYQSDFSPIELSYTSCSLGTTIVNKHTLDVSLQEKIRKKDVIDSVVQNSGLTFEALKRISLNSEISIYKDLESATEIVKKSWLERDDVSLHVGLIDLTKRLNVDPKFWMDAILAGQTELAEKLIVQLGDMSNYFLKSCFTTPHPSIINPEKIYVFKKIIYLQNLICQLRDPYSEWANLAFTEFNHENFYNILTDNKMRSDVAFINAYSSHSNSNNENLIDLNRVSPESFVGLKLIYKNDNSKTVEKIIRRTYPLVVQEIKKSDKNFDNLPEKCQDAHIFASDLLPPWLKAMRDTCLSGLHLQKSDVGPLTSLDRNVDIVTHFKINDFPSLCGSFINVSFVGVNKEILNDAEVKRIKENELNFAGNYLNENSQFLNEIESIFLSNYNYDSSEVNEKQLFQMFKNSNDTNFKEIAHVFLNKKLSHIEALEYFTNHPEKLKDRDFQILLHIIIFGSNLESKLKIKGFENQLAQFIHRNYHLFLEENEIHTAVFLLKISNQLKHFCPDTPFFKEAIVELEKLIHRKEIGNEERSIIYAELVAQIGSKDILNTNDVKSLLLGSIYLKKIK